MHQLEHFYTEKARTIEALLKTPAFSGRKDGFIMSTQPGTHDPVAVKIGSAAEFILTGKFRVATDEEVQGFLDSQARKRAAVSLADDPISLARAQFGLLRKGGE